MSGTAAMLKNILNFLYPPNCAICGCPQSLDTDHRVCGACLASIERITEPFCNRCGVPLAIGAGVETAADCQRCRQSPPCFTAARSALRYHSSSDLQEGTVGSMVRRLKYGLDRSLAPALAECIADRLPFPAGSHDLVVSVPLHKARLRWRGFNQAALLGAAVARRLGCTFDPATLARVRHTPPQTTLNHRSRARNMHGAFVCSGSRPVTNRRILLVDDVMTTGATADECARALLDAGAASVDVFTLARVL